jgi:hypothetical protein
VDVLNIAYYYPVPGLSTGHFFHGGDTITNLTGVLHWSFASQSGTDAWCIRPVMEAFSYASGPRTSTQVCRMWAVACPPSRMSARPWLRPNRMIYHKMVLQWTPSSWATSWRVWAYPSASR